MIKHRVTFVLHRRSVDSETAHLECRVKWDGSRQIVSLSTGYAVDPERWDARMQLCTPRSFHGRSKVPAAVINAEVERWKAVAEALFVRYDHDGKWPSTDQLRSDLRVELGLDRKVSEGLLPTYARFISEQSAKNGWSESTVKSLRVLRGYLDKCGIFAGLDDFTEDNLLRFVTWLQTDRHQVDSSRFKYYGYLHWFLKWADEKGMLTVTDYRTFRPSFKKSTKPVIYLEWDELMRLWEWEPNPKIFTQTELVKVRDVFCFCAFTSLRYSDAMNLRWADIEEHSFRVTTVKTKDPLIIELNKWSQEILNRYVDCSFDDDKVFPYMHNQCMNRDLKSLCHLCGIDKRMRLTSYRGGERVDEVVEKWQVIGTHAGRRTFICNALMMGISPQVVMQWTGHSDWSAMKPYIAIADEAKRKAMSLFDDR